MRRPLPDHLRSFTLRGARQTLKHVRRITASCREEMEHLWQELGPNADPDRLHLFFVRMNVVKDRWYHAMKLLGIWPRKLWEVDFNGGDGSFYSWRTGDEDIKSMHRDPYATYPRRVTVPSKQRKTK